LPPPRTRFCSRVPALTFISQHVRTDNLVALWLQKGVPPLHSPVTAAVCPGVPRCDRVLRTARARP
jgi:hypothetical protein